MTDIVEVAIIVAIAPTIAAIGAIFIGLRNGKKTDNLEIKVDGRLTQLLDMKDQRIAAVAVSSKAQGVLEEKDRQESK